MYPVIICEDNPIELQQLSIIIENYLLSHGDNFYLAFKTQSPVELLEYVQRSHTQKAIYFLDIDLNHELSGIDAAEKIRKMDSLAKFIFVTTHEEMAPLTLKKNLEALAFIEKNQSLEDLRQAILQALELAQARLIETQKAQKENLTFCVGSRLFNIDINDVLFLEPSGRHHRLILHTTNGQYDFIGKLIDYEKKYPKLFRSSKSSLINPDNVTEIDFSTRKIWFNQGLSCHYAISKTKKIKQLFDVTSSS